MGITSKDDFPTMAPPRPRLRLETAFALIALFFGQLLVVVIPPFQSADEPFHLLRAYEISEGVIIHHQVDARGYAAGELPQSLYEIWLPFSHIGFHPETKAQTAVIRSAFKIPLNPAERMFITFPVTAYYCALCYLPQSLGILFGRAIGAPALALLYLGRESNLLFWIFLGYWSVKLSGPLTRPIFLILLMPMSLYVACTVSADAPTNALAALFTANICDHLSRDDARVNLPRYVLLAALAISISICKFAYAPLLALLLLVPIARFASVRRAVFTLLPIGLICALAILYFNSNSRGLALRIRNDAQVSPPAQWHYLRAHASSIGPLIFHTFEVKAWGVLQTYVGLIGWLDEYIPPWFVIVYLTVLLLACIHSRRWTQQLPLKPIALAVIPAVVISASIITLLSYLFWTPVAFPYVDGVHGRYLIPLSPAAAMLMVATTQRLRLRFSASEGVLNLLATCFSIFSSAFFLWLVWRRYYG